METDTPHDQEDPHSQADEGHLQDGAGGQGPGAVHMIDRRKTLALCKMIDRRMWQSPLSLRHFKLGHAIQEIGRMMTHIREKNSKGFQQSPAF